ncbi:MAG: MmcB family DNA repair protein [Candidatus Nanoarchaeia archaeon]|jgi:hypothetical protein|nr:MmcB family DNA repair protein [Candidatus Nanoarchaeia archaeon]
MLDSKKIIKFLAEKHSNDIFVVECKNGSTWFENHRRLDAWSMKKSWKNQCYTGYEIKISKSDFKSDSKFVDYLSMCNELYFVCPWEMISVSEIPLEVGLIYVSKNETKLIIRKKAVKRQIEEPINVLKYILMYRTKIERECSIESNKDYWKNWQKEKSENIEIGRISSKRLKQLFEEKIEKISKENDELKFKNEVLIEQHKRYDDVKEMLLNAGLSEFDIRPIRVKYAVEKLINKLDQKVPEQFKNAIISINNYTKELIDIFNKE